MIIKVNIEKIEEIQDLVNEGKYEDIHNFIKIAIRNQLEEEQNSDTLKLEIKDISKSETLNWGERILELESLTSEIEVKHENLILSFYNRLFPIKLIVYYLAKQLINSNKSQIPLEELHEGCFEFAHKLAIKLRKYEKDNVLGRNKKISTGLPSVIDGLDKMRGKARKEKLDKWESGKNRFMKQQIGNYNSGTHYFEGACFTFGLLNISYDTSSSSCLVSLSQLGKDFAILSNPIIGENDFKKGNFSFKEIKFIYDEILPQFSLENKIIQKIIQMLKNSELSYSNDIDPILEEFRSEILEYYQASKMDKEKQDKRMTNTRVAIMGRLHELQIVYWNIDRLGKSTYTLNKKTVYGLDNNFSEYQKISDMDFSGKDLSDMDFSGKDLSGADFSNCVTSHTNFAKASLIDANFSNSQLQVTNFTNANLTNANFTNAHIAHSVFFNANCTDANLCVKRIGNVDFRQVNLKDAKLSKEFNEPEKYLIELK
jgi:Arc/MetJ-type ribon-helix-helix transcriptional regulator